MSERMIYGWLSEDERMALRRWAFGCTVLEVGAYEGLSTSQMCMTADHVTTVDTFDGRATGREYDTEEAFHLNMKACGSAHKVFAIKGESGAVLPKLTEKHFGFIFIDGDHSYEYVRKDATLARALLADGGALAFHDYDAGHPGVVQTVNELVADGMYLAEQTNSLVVLKEGPRPERGKPRVAILFPSYNGWFKHAGIPTTRQYNHHLIRNGSSIITTTFNKLLVEVMNADREFTYLAMLHADVVPDAYWLDTMIAELEMNHLDMVSSVIPLKDKETKRGLTSTGLEVVGSQWSVRRLALREIYGWGLPETFRAQDIPGRTDQGLLLNSGCWVMRWDRAWKRGLHFRQQDRIMWNLTERKYGAESSSEDWDWSRQLLSRGCRLGATTKVKLIHDDPEYHNRGPWGEWSRDEDFFREEAIIRAAQCPTPVAEPDHAGV